jgi:hypothetical protein
VRGGSIRVGLHHLGEIERQEEERVTAVKMAGKEGEKTQEIEIGPVAMIIGKREEGKVAFGTGLIHAIGKVALKGACLTSVRSVNAKSR